MNAITRRDFVRGTVGATLGVSVAGMTGNRCFSAASSSKVTLVRDANAHDENGTVNAGVVATMLEKSLTAFTGQETAKQAWLSLIGTDKIIGLVPTPHLNPTHDQVVDAVKASLIKAGIPEDNIRQAQGGPEKVKACDVLISLPALKAHWLTGIGTVLKNYILYSGSPSSYHEADSAKLGKIWQLPFVKDKTKIVLVDALYPLCDKGPQPDPRYKWAYNGLIAGTDPVAVESACLKIIEAKRKELRGEEWPLSPPPLCIEAADKEYGLGTSDWKNISVEKIGWSEGILI